MASIPEHPLLDTLQTAVQHHQAGRLTEAESLYRQVLEAQPENANALHLLGVIAYQQGKHEAAVEMIQRAIVLNPNAAEFYNNCGEAFRAMGRLDAAMECYQKAVALNPGFAMAHNNLGIAYHAQGSLDQARACYEKTIALAPNLAEAYYHLGRIHLAQGRKENAVACLEKAIGNNPVFASAYFELGNVLQLLGQLDSAVLRYQKALELKPDYPEAFNNLGNIFHAQKKIDDAIACYYKAIKLRHDYVMAHNNLANVHVAEGRLEAAVARYKKILELKPDFAEAYYNLGNALHELGEMDDAIRSYETAIAIKPGYVEAHNNLGVILREVGRPERALACFREVASIYQSILGIPPEYRRTAHKMEEVEPPPACNDSTRHDVSDITIATSIAPRNIDTQRHAIDSWRRIGFHVVSLNSQEEIDTLKPSFPDMEFVPVRRDAQKDFGKPYVYFDDVLEYFRNSDCKICGIANSDIHFPDKGFGGFVHKEAGDSFLFGCRVEIPFLGATEGDVYQKGFDYFFFHRKFLDVYPAENFCLGLPWWDYWAVLIPILSDVRVKKLETPAGYHVSHPPNWNYNYWVTFGLAIAKYLGAAEPPTMQHLNIYDKYIWTLIETGSVKVPLPTS